MRKLRDLAKKLQRLDGLALLLARLSVGAMFVESGVNKLRKLHEFIEYFTKLGIPAPSVQAPMVAAVELVCGALIALGLGTRIAAAPLAGTMVVAILTARLSEAKVKTLGDFLYLPEWLLIVVLVQLVVFGAGRISLDWRLAKRSASTESPASPSSPHA